LITNELSKERLKILETVIFLIITIIILRLVWLQLLLGAEFRGEADNNRIRILSITAPRGTFYDRNGIPLVTSRPGFSVSLVPINEPISDDVINRLAPLLGMKPNDIKNKITQNNVLAPVRIKDDVDQEILTKIAERQSEFPGVVIEVQAVRNYINQDLAAHLFGYVGEISTAELNLKKTEGYTLGSLVGKFGLEKVYDQEIRGEDGGQQIEVDVEGTPTRIIGKKEPVLGNELVLTIDAKIQKATEKAMDDRLRFLQDRFGNPNAKAAAAVVMNPQTGEILALVSRPAFNPNIFNGGISSKDWKEINDNPFNPMQNRTISAEYPPGSSFKIVTGSAALEAGKVTSEEKIMDSGTHWLVPKGNAHNMALGWIDFNVAMAKSDNVYFYELGNRLGIDLLETWARNFGLGSPTGINLPGESEGLVANRKYKMQVYEEEWYLSETFDAAIGQGFQLVTPLQMACVVSQIANGGHRYRPYVVSKILSPSGEVIKTFEPEELGKVNISEKNLKTVRDSLRDVISPRGTAGYIFENFPMQIAGKTSTAENPHGDDHGWFVAYGPFDHPTLVVAVVVEQGGYGSDSAGPIARKIFEAAFNLPPHKDMADLYNEEIAEKTVNSNPKTLR